MRLTRTAGAWYAPAALGNGAGRGTVSKQPQQHAPGVAAGGSTEITVHPESRLVVFRILTETRLTGAHGTALVDALTSVIGASGEPFGLLADAGGVSGTDADYRAVTGRFFGEHRATARIALLNLGPIIRVVAEMFRVGIGVQLRTFPDEPAARAWLRTQGIPA